MTTAAWRFEREHRRVLSFVFYITGLATSTDEKARIASKNLLKKAVRQLPLGLVTAKSSLDEALCGPDCDLGGGAAC